MHCTVKMTEDLYWVGASDRRLALFESVYPIPAYSMITQQILSATVLHLISLYFSMSLKR